MKNSEPSLDKLVLKAQVSHLWGHDAEEQVSTSSVHPHLHMNSAFNAVPKACQRISSFSYHMVEQIMALAPATSLEVSYLAEEERWENSLMNVVQ